MQAGEGITDITPPLGIELAGFHKPPGKERVVTGVRQPCAARALVLKQGETTVALVSLEVCGFPREFTARLQKQIQEKTGIPAANVRVCATHTHSAPTLRFFRQWGAVSPDYAEFVERRAMAAAELAVKDLAEADCYLGAERAKGANFNRTSKTWKTDAEFGADSTDDERWLDTALHSLHFLREKPKKSLLWYHFSAHPVCYTDGLAGPDWPGLAAQKTKERDDLAPGFLQGHIGDVNPGNGTPHLGDPEKISEAIYSALHHSTNHSVHLPVQEIQVVSEEIEIPLDFGLLKDQLDRYRADPEKCTQGEWVDAGFAKDWIESASRWKPGTTRCRTVITAMRLGNLAFHFHPAELYSFYGLAIRRDSPFPVTWVVGYADDFVGYLTDPQAYKKGEYAAIVVPKILDWPPFKPEAAAEFAAAAGKLLQQLA